MAIGEEFTRGHLAAINSILRLITVAKPENPLSYLQGALDMLEFIIDKGEALALPREVKE